MEEALYAGLDTVGLAADCAGAGGTGKGGGDGPDKPRNGNGGGGPGCNSFPAGTGVLLADGTTRSIEDVAPGDEVAAADPLTGEAGPRAVTDAWHHADGPLVTLYTLDARGRVGRLMATADHPVWEASDRAWEPAGGLGRGDALLGADGAALSVLRVEAAEGEAEVWDLTVAGLHTYYVASGDGWALVHNADCSGPHGRPVLAEAQRIADGHSYHEHIGEYDDIESREEFARMIDDVIRHPDDTIRRGDRTYYWSDHYETVVVVAPGDRDGGSAFRPDEGRDYFEDQR